MIEEIQIEEAVVLVETLDPKEFGLELKDVKPIEAAFLPKIMERERLALRYGNIINQQITPELCEQAAVLYKEVNDNIKGIAEVHKVQKSFAWNFGKLCDSKKNMETLPGTQMKEGLLPIKNHYKILEEKRLLELKEKRIKEAEPFSEFIPFGIELQLLDEDGFNSIIAGAKLQQQAKIDQQKKEEEDRIKEEKEAEALRLEAQKKSDLINKRTLELAPYLPFVDMPKEEVLVNDVYFTSFINNAKIAKNKHEKAQEKIKADNAKLVKENEAKAKQEQINKKAKEKLEKELQAIKDKEVAEAAAKSEKEKASKLEAKKLAAAPDKDKLLTLSKVLFEYNLPEMNTDEGKAIVKNVESLLMKTSNYIIEQTEKL